MKEAARTCRIHLIHHNSETDGSISNIHVVLVLFRLGKIAWTHGAQTLQSLVLFALKKHGTMSLQAVGCCEGNQDPANLKLKHRWLVQVNSPLQKHRQARHNFLQSSAGYVTSNPIDLIRVAVPSSLYLK